MTVLAEMFPPVVDNAIWSVEIEHQFPENAPMKTNSRFYVLFLVLFKANDLLAADNSLFARAVAH